MKKRVLTALVGIPVLILGVFFAPIWLFGVIIAVICGFVAFELMRCAIGQAPKRLYISSILSAVAIAIFGGLDLRMAAIILLFLFFVLSCEMMACFSTPRKISMEMVAISMLAGGVLPMMLSTLLRIAQFETTISIPELLNGNSTLVRITHDGIVGRVRAFLPFVVAFGSDAGAYFCGRAFGKKQLAPAISPHKTVAGGIGGGPAVQLLLDLLRQDGLQPFGGRLGQLLGQPCRPQQRHDDDGHPRKTLHEALPDPQHQCQQQKCRHE